MGDTPAPVHRSVSTWQQPLPAFATAGRAALLDLVASRIVALSPGRLRVGVDAPGRRRQDELRALVRG